MKLQYNITDTSTFWVLPYQAYVVVAIHCNTVKEDGCIVGNTSIGGAAYYLGGAV